MKTPITYIESSDQGTIHDAIKEAATNPDHILVAHFKTGPVVLFWSEFNNAVVALSPVKVEAIQAAIKQAIEVEAERRDQSTPYPN